MSKIIQIQHSLSPEQAAQLNALIDAHVQAQIADSWKGGGDPNDIPLIEAEAEVARLKLERFINKLVEVGQ
jgi:hypothetical protein